MERPGFTKQAGDLPPNSHKLDRQCYSFYYVQIIVLIRFWGVYIKVPVGSPYDWSEVDFTFLG